jgi:hypothetical protein
MYLELAVAWAVLSFGVGLTLLLDLSFWYVLLTNGITLIFALGLYLSAKESHQVLCETRDRSSYLSGELTPAATCEMKGGSS